MNPTRARSCQGKVRHRSRGGAERAIASLGRKDGDLALQAYPCGHCGGWHVGHPSKAADRQKLRYTRLLALIERANRKDPRP